MKEIVVISGKGGTGKTSLTSAFAALAENPVLADCDVDAADLHLILQPEVTCRTEFFSGNEAVVNQNKCSGCTLCGTICRFDAVTVEEGTVRIDAAACEGCGVCVAFCPEEAMEFPVRQCGEWYESKTRYGTMIHARLGIAAENSGKLVSLVRKEARRAASDSADFILVDGPPGTGCPVIASVTGADAVVVVTEPTLSGKHDLVRVMKLTAHFGIKTYVCVNKWDLNVENSRAIKELTALYGNTFLGMVPYSQEITKAQIAGQSIIEYGSDELKEKFTEIWNNLVKLTKGN